MTPFIPHTSPEALGGGRSRNPLPASAMFRNLIVSAIVVGVAAIAICFGWMLASGGLSALPSFAFFCAGGICAAAFSAFLVPVSDAVPEEEAAA